MNKKKLLSLLLSVVLMGSVGVNAFAAEDEASVSYEDEIEISGVHMSADDFKVNFSGDPSERKSTSVRTKSSSSNMASDINIADIEISGQDIELTAELYLNGTSVILPIEGQLCAGFKAKHGVNSTIIVVPEPVNGYEILLFELYNDTEEGNLLLSSMTNENVSSCSHMKLYMQDEDGTVYLFETDMPDCFRELEADDYPAAPKEKDALWALKLADVEIKELETNDEILNELGLNSIQPMGLNTWTTWLNPTTYYSEFYIGSDHCQCWSLPYVEYRHANVTSSDSTWAASFKVAEHTKIGSYTEHGNNVFEYRNLKMAFACGDKTTFIRTFQEGRVYDDSVIGGGLKGAGKKIAVSLLSKAVSALPYGSTLSSVLGYINSAASTNREVTLGSTGMTLSNRKTVAVGEKLDDKFKFEACTDYDGQTNNGHYFTYQAVLQHEAVSGNTNTVGALVVEFDVFSYEDYSTNHVKKEFQLNYKSTP